jgi:phenylacetate-CoA ligase
VALSLYGLYLQHQRYGGRSRLYVEELLRHDRLSAAEIAEMQLKMLRDRALLAVTRVPAYRALAGRRAQIESATDPRAILDCFPVLTKDAVRIAPEQYIPEGLPEKLLVGSTGGTTGKPLRLYRTLDGMRRNFAFFGRIRRWRGLDQWSRTATFMGRIVVPAEQDRPPFWRTAHLTRNLLFSNYHMSPRNLPAYARKLAAWNPEEIVCYPSGGFLVAQAVLREGIRLRCVKAVFTTAETLTDEMRATMEEAFGCPIADQYGSGEWTVTISQCERGTYHQHPDYGYLETLDAADGRLVEGTGRLVATGFINDATVLMRYDTGDLVSLRETDCGCGRAFPTVARIEGRNEEFIVTPDGGRLGRFNNFVFAGLNGVVEGQVVQYAVDRLEIRVVPDATWSEAVRAAIVEAVRLRLGETTRVEVALVDSIPRTISGKFRAVIGLGAGGGGG